MSISIKLDDKQFSIAMGKLGAIVAALDDLKAAVVRVVTDAAAEIKAVSDKLTALGDSVSAADVADAVGSLNAAAQTLEDETKVLTS